MCRVSEEIYKLCSVNLSPNVTGQVAMGIMCNPPRPGSESYELHMKEKDLLLQSLIRRARSITDAFNRCNCSTPLLSTNSMMLLLKVD